LESKQEQPVVGTPRLVQTHSGASVPSVAAYVKRGLDQRRLSRVLDYIDANLESEVTLDRMASIACLSRFHFVRAFRNALGQSPVRYVSARRLERAEVLLLQRDRTLVDIALARGFSSQTSFTRAFSQATGVTPGQYRREVMARVDSQTLL